VKTSTEARADYALSILDCDHPRGPCADCYRRAHDSTEAIAFEIGYTAGELAADDEATRESAAAVCGECIHASSLMPVEIGPGKWAHSVYIGCPTVLCHASAIWDPYARRKKAREGR
jgi:hypothetical protein